MTSITIADDGIVLVVTPYDKVGGDYVSTELRLTNPRSLTLDLTGSLDSADLRNLEVSSFKYELAPDDLLSGTISFLPAGKGFWTIEFTGTTFRFSNSVT